MPDVDTEALLAALDEVVPTGRFILKDHCAELEQRLAERYAVPEVIVTSSVPAALLLTLTALGAGRLRVALASPVAAWAPALVTRCGGVVADSSAEADLRVTGTELVTVSSGGPNPSTHAVIRDLGPGSPFRGVGEAAAVQTDDVALAVTLRMLRNHGQGAERFRHEAVGFNARMDEIPAAYLLKVTPW
jgi:dTDP-4-amino-4,6-dideoxygalactose transaminase